MSISFSSGYGVEQGELPPVAVFASPVLGVAEQGTDCVGFFGAWCQPDHAGPSYGLGSLVELLLGHCIRRSLCWCRKNGLMLVLYNGPVFVGVGKMV